MCRVGVLGEEVADRRHVECRPDAKVLVEPWNDVLRQQREQVRYAPRCERKFSLDQRNEDKEQPGQDEAEQQHDGDRRERSRDASRLGTVHDRRAEVREDGSHQKWREHRT